MGAAVKSGKVKQIPFGSDNQKSEGYSAGVGLVGVAVAVVMVVTGFGGEFADGDDAAFEFFAAAEVFELNGGVVDVEVVFYHGVDFKQDAVALRGRDVSDGDVAGEGVGLGAEAPDVEVVDVEDAFDRLHVLADMAEGEAARCAFEEDVEGFADDIDGTPEDHGGDEDGEDGVDPVLAGELDGEASGDNGGGGEGVAGHVDEGGAHVDVACDGPEEGSDDAVHEDSGGGDGHHDVGVHCDWFAEAVDGFNADPERYNDQGCCVEEGGEDAGTLVAKGFPGVRRASLKVDGNEGEREGEEVGGVVASLREQRERVGADAGNQGEHHVDQGGEHGEPQNPLGAGGTCRVGVDVHGPSLSVIGGEGKGRELC